MSDSLSLVFRWLHIIPAIVMVGGVFYVRFCLVDARSNEPALFDSQDAIRRRWVKLVMLSTLLLLISGLYNAATKAMGFQLGMTYNALLGIKILLALAVFYLTAVLAGRSERAKRFRQQEARWLNILLVLMLLIVMIAGYMKIESADSPKKVRGQEEQTVSHLRRSSFRLDAASMSNPHPESHQIKNRKQ